MCLGQSLVIGQRKGILTSKIQHIMVTSRAMKVQGVQLGSCVDAHCSSNPSNFKLVEMKILNSYNLHYKNHSFLMLALYIQNFFFFFTLVTSRLGKRYTYSSKGENNYVISFESKKLMFSKSKTCTIDQQSQGIGAVKA